MKIPIGKRRLKIAFCNTGSILPTNQCVTANDSTIIYKTMPTSRYPLGLSCIIHQHQSQCCCLNWKLACEIVLVALEKLHLHWSFSLAIGTNLHVSDKSFTNHMGFNWLSHHSRKWRGFCRQHIEMHFVRQSMQFEENFIYLYMYFQIPIYEKSATKQLWPKSIHYMASLGTLVNQTSIMKYAWLTWEQTPRNLPVKCGAVITRSIFSKILTLDTS